MGKDAELRVKRTLQAFFPLYILMSKLLLPLCIVMAIGLACGKSDSANVPVPSSYKHMLALGDSYTIGESVPTAERFSIQTVQQLMADSIYFDGPEIIAQTGWTTGNLLNRLATAPPQRSTYDAVTLLIGVNNQFQRRSQNEYRTEFTDLLQQAIRYADNRPARVTVISIPDWGVTPFANGYNRALIAAEIDSFNRINQSVTASLGSNYVNITPISRQAATDGSLLAPDSLHPSGRMYQLWAEQIRPVIRASLQ